MERTLTEAGLHALLQSKARRRSLFGDIIGAVEPTLITERIVQMIPGATYRGRIQVTSLASDARVEKELSRWFSDVHAWGGPPNDSWPESQRSKDAPWGQRIVFIEGKWKGPAGPFDSGANDDVTFKAKWVHAMPEGASPPAQLPKITPKPVTPPNVLPSGSIFPPPVENPPAPRMGLAPVGIGIALLFGTALIVRKR